MTRTEKMYSYKQIGAQIKEHLKKMEMTQKELAEVSGLRQTEISNMIHGKGINVARLSAISTKLNTTTEALLSF